MIDIQSGFHEGNCFKYQLRIVDCDKHPIHIPQRLLGSCSVQVERYRLFNFVTDNISTNIGTFSQAKIFQEYAP